MNIGGIENGAEVIRYIRVEAIVTISDSLVFARQLPV